MKAAVEFIQHVQEFAICTLFQRGYKMKKAMQEFTLLFSLLVTAQVFTLMIQLIP